LAVRDSADLFPEQSGALVELVNSPGAALENCELQALHAIGVVVTGLKFTLQLSNSAFLGRSFVRAEIEQTNSSQLLVERCTIAAQTFVAPTKRSHDDGSILVLNVRSCLLDVGTVVTIPPTLRASVNLTENWEWRGAGNLYSVHDGFLRTRTPRANDLTSLADWRKFWSVEEPGSIESRVVFAALPLTSEGVTNFHAAQLASTTSSTLPSPAGAPFSEVGPGPVYHTWHRSPAYTQWLGRISAMLDAAPQSR
jgi:hypothetical protein